MTSAGFMILLWVQLLLESSCWLKVGAIYKLHCSVIQALASAAACEGGSVLACTIFWACGSTCIVCACLLHACAPMCGGIHVILRPQVMQLVSMPC